MPGEAIVTRAEADLFFGALFLLGLITALAIFAIAKKRGQSDGFSAALLWGGPLVLVGVMWRVYNAIIDRMGLDRVANLVVNLVLFVFLGAACGAGWALKIKKDISTGE